MEALLVEKEATEGEAAAAATLLHMAGPSSSKAGSSKAGPSSSKAPPPLAAASTARALKQVTTPIIIEKAGYSRKRAAFKVHSGGVAKILPSTNQPVTTRREKALFHELLPMFRSGMKGRVDWAGFLRSWQLAFLNQDMPGVPGQPLMEGEEAASMVYTKKPYHLKAYLKVYDEEMRSKENRSFNRKVQSAPLPPSSHDGQALLSFTPRPQQHQQPSPTGWI